MGYPLQNQPLSELLRINNDNTTPEAQEALRLIATHLPASSVDSAPLADQLAILAQLAPINLKLNVQPSHIPIIGRFITQAKLALHQLILFYLNDLAAQQSTFNHQLLKVLRQLADPPERS